MLLWSKWLSLDNSTYTRHKRKCTPGFHNINKYVTMCTSKKEDVWIKVAKNGKRLRCETGFSGQAAIFYVWSRRLCCPNKFLSSTRTKLIPLCYNFGHPLLPPSVMQTSVVIRKRMHNTRSWPLNYNKTLIWPLKNAKRLKKSNKYCYKGYSKYLYTF